MSQSLKRINTFHRLLDDIDESIKKTDSSSGGYDFTLSPSTLYSPTSEGNMAVDKSVQQNATTGLTLDKIPLAIIRHSGKLDIQDSESDSSMIPERPAPRRLFTVESVKSLDSYGSVSNLSKVNPAFFNASRKTYSQAWPRRVSTQCRQVRCMSLNVESTFNYSEDISEDLNCEKVQYPIIKPLDCAIDLDSYPDSDADQSLCKAIQESNNWAGYLERQG